MSTRIVIVGAGPAGVAAVETLRMYDQQSEIVMLSSEPYPPYSPPAMMDHFMTGSLAHLWRGEDWPARIGIHYYSGVQANTVEPEAHRVRLSDGTVLDYDQLVIATGSRLYAPLDGADLPGVYNFKSLSAAEALVKRVKSGEAKTALIVGAGFIGMEIALLLRELGVQVTQVEMLDQLMPRMLDEHTAGFALEVMHQRGVDVHLNTEASAIIGQEHAKGVRLRSGDILEADILIAATGVRPNIDFLDGSGIQTRWGIVVDENLRTSVKDVYAAGDVVETPDLLTGESYVHAIFPNAVEQGHIVGMNLAGFDVKYEGAERMNSLKHLDLPVMVVGLKEGDEVLSTRMNGNQRTLYLQDNRIVGFQLIGDIRAAGTLRTLMKRAQDVRRIKDRLLEPTFGQGTLAWNAISATV